ncbi:MAG: bifunctional 23S rRNA (guanine(2069)-N(7))-methyltransferase RlmK/23S rRNA (guanine(2445)-N(2))-methyltransferase RlmL [Methylococcaceae bacterium]|nr:bifunctional 23S rRNA (guanine(2069)-N(7))-methyltransferase RlmK/23S rRNA (guanine(2445)-N(2))-methyltransferase RlmL [Methylococcaceae bacterium]
MTHYSLFATTPKAMEDILTDELKALGATNLKATIAGVAFEGTLETAYRVCLWSRTANRILLRLKEFEANTPDELYEQVKKINWFEHLKPEGSFVVSLNAKNSKVLNNTHFGALKVKDAIVDQMRAKFQKRPNIDTDRPDIHINVHLNDNKVQLSLDLSGDSLHKRGYRDVSIDAPIKQNLAAAILLRSGWPAMAATGGSFIDPMCGSGTLVLEAAMIAADYAPSLLRDYFGFLGWKKHEADIWQSLKEEAETRKAKGLENMPKLVGFDQSRRTIAIALQHVENAGLQDFIHLEKRDINDTKPAESWAKGLLVCNPPYGERLSDLETVTELYQQFGEVLRTEFIGWKAAMIISNPELGFRLGIRSHKPITFHNGALECKLLRLDIEEASFFTPKAKNQDQRHQQIIDSSQGEHGDSGALMFANRLRKNLKNIKKWVKQHEISCYRLYDADLPEYAVAIDIYQGNELWVNVQEYEAPKTIDSHKANQRLAGILAEIPKVLNVDSDQVFLKIRRKQKSTAQYEKLSDSGQFHVINEGHCKLLVNFEEYLDTGLFLDHRPLRLMIAQQAKGKRFLNLFAYTGSASVHAAVGGAASTTTVDMSNTYLDWAKKNFDLNRLSGSQYQFVRNDCMEWLENAQQTMKGEFDLIFLDPPTFSNSKRMEQAFDIQVEHVKLIQQSAKLLSDEGVLYFSTNFRRFKLDEEGLDNLQIENISATTVPHDFSRSPKIHYCWRITR